MAMLKRISRLLTSVVPGKERRKTARLKVEDGLNALFRTEKFICTKNFEADFVWNVSLPREKFHIISLGTNCFARMTLNLWGLKPRKADGEPSMPFDLAVHPLPVVVKYLKNRFDKYFDGIQYDEENGYWVKPQDGISFVHEKENNRIFFEERYQKRISALFAAMEDDTPCLFVCHVPGDVDGRDADDLYQVLKTYCGHKKFELLLVVFNGTVGKCNENIKIYADEFPYKGYLYMDKKVKFTQAGYGFEEPFVRCCREEVIKLTENGNA